MTDREKMVEVIDNWNVDNDFPLRAIDLGTIADRLIEAGFGVVKKDDRPHIRDYDWEDIE